MPERIRLIYYNNSLYIIIMNISAVTLNDGIKFDYFTNDNLAHNSIGNNEQWETHITKFVKIYNNLYNIQNIIDIGANFGYHTVHFSKDASGFVFAFEPQSQNYQILKNNIDKNNIQNVILYNYACGDINCDVKMPVMIDSVNKVNMGDFTPNVLNNDNYTITTSVLLDEMNFPQIDLIKIDVQGWEKKVLIGSCQLLKQYKPALIVEFESHQLLKTNTTCKELFDFIRDNNYYIFYLEYDYPSDHICIHNDNLKEFRNKFKNYIFPHTTMNNVNYNIMYGINEKLAFP